MKAVFSGVLTARRRRTSTMVVPEARSVEAKLMGPDANPWTRNLLRRHEGSGSNPRLREPACRLAVEIADILAEARKHAGRDVFHRHGRQAGTRGDARAARQH